MILSGQRVAFLSGTAGNTSMPIPGRYSGWGVEIPRPIALYREPFDDCGAARIAPGTAPPKSGSSTTPVTRRARLPLGPRMSRPAHLEVQDVRYEARTLYFNEACQSYAREAGGRCSALVGLDGPRPSLRRAKRLLRER